MMEEKRMRLVAAMDTSTDMLACAVAEVVSEETGLTGSVLAATDH